MHRKKNCGCRVLLVGQVTTLSLSKQGFESPTRYKGIHNKRKQNPKNTENKALKKCLFLLYSYKSGVLSFLAPLWQPRKINNNRFLFYQRQNLFLKNRFLYDSVVWIIFGIINLAVMDCIFTLFQN